MTAIVIDLEWNYPERGPKKNGLPGEIIQIGAAKISMEGEILDSFSATIRPVVYWKMNKDVSELTLIKQEDINAGEAFSKAAGDFKKWCGEEFVFISWGDSDTRMLKDNLIYFGLDASWLPATYDAQLMFDDYEMQEDRSWPLNYALYHFKERPDGQHNALADVKSTVLVLRHFDIREALKDEYFIIEYSC